MSNGAQCCALEICCDPQSLRAKLPALVAKHAGVSATMLHGAIVHQVLDMMAHEGITFAPASMRKVITDIVTAERARVAKA